MFSLVKPRFKLLADVHRDFHCFNICNDYQSSAIKSSENDAMIELTWLIFIKSNLMQSIYPVILIKRHNFVYGRSFFYFIHIQRFNICTHQMYNILVVRIQNSVAISLGVCLDKIHRNK